MTISAEAKQVLFALAELERAGFIHNETTELVQNGYGLDVQEVTIPAVVTFEGNEFIKEEFLK